MLDRLKDRIQGLRIRKRKSTFSLPHQIYTYSTYPVKGCFIQEMGGKNTKREAKHFYETFIHYTRTGKEGEEAQMEFHI